MVIEALLLLYVICCPNQLTLSFLNSLTLMYLKILLFPFLELNLSPWPWNCSLQCFDGLLVEMRSQLAKGSDYVYLHQRRVFEIALLQSLRMTANSFPLQRYQGCSWLGLSKFSHFYSSQSHLFGLLSRSWRRLWRAGPFSSFMAHPRPAKRDWQRMFSILCSDNPHNSLWAEC